MKWITGLHRVTTNEIKNQGRKCRFRKHTWETENYHVMWWFLAVSQSGDCCLICVHSNTITWWDKWLTTISSHDRFSLPNRCYRPRLRHRHIPRYRLRRTIECVYVHTHTHTHTCKRTYPSTCTRTTSAQDRRHGCMEDAECYCQRSLPTVLRQTHKGYYF